MEFGVAANESMNGWQRRKVGERKTCRVFEHVCALYVCACVKMCEWVCVLACDRGGG